MYESSGNVEGYIDHPNKSHRPCGDAAVCRLASLGHDVVAMVRDIQVASRRLTYGIALRVAEDASALKWALAGIDDMVLNSSHGDESAVMCHHANAIEAVSATNIRHITLTSLPSRASSVPTSYCHSTSHLFTETRRAPTSGLQCAFGHHQMCLYSDFTVKHWLVPSHTSQQLVPPTGRVWLHRSRVARWRPQVAAVAAKPDNSRIIYMITSNRALGLARSPPLFGNDCEADAIVPVSLTNT